MARLASASQSGSGRTGGRDRVCRTGWCSRGEHSIGARRIECFGKKEKALSVGLRLLAKFEREWDSPDVALHRLKEWIERDYRDLRPEARTGFVGAYPTVFCQFHPAAEEIELSLIDLRHLTVSANTSTVGPGYHIFLCSMLRRLATTFNAVWQPEDEENYLDESGYFSSGEEQRAVDEMIRWLRGVAELVLAESSEGMSSFALGMAMDEQFFAESFALTPMGPRDRVWFEKTSQDGSRGRDFFAWWKPDLDAEYFLNRALTKMWTQVRWRRPSNASETDDLKYVAESLDVAYKLDPKLNFPWAEWAQILRYLNISDPLVGSKASGKPTIGYRRGNVQVSMPGGWLISVPGSFSEFRANENHNYCAFDPPREIWFTSFRYTEKDSAMFENTRAEIVSGQPELLHELDNYVARAEIAAKHDNGDPYYLLKSSNVTIGQRSVCTIVFKRPEDRDWAIEVWKSIKPPSPKD